MQSSEISTPQPIDSTPTSSPKRQLDWKFYRIGIVGSKESGKTCLITSLTMLRDPNPNGFTADLQAPSPNEDTALQKGREWIMRAKDCIRDGRWPEANPDDDEHKAIRFRFSDGQTRQKFVEVFDYSGELLNPKLSNKERASKLRELLAQMDGLLVIAEHPLSHQHINKVEDDLKGLMEAFALLLDEKVSKRISVHPPIALIVNKWDRSDYYDPEADAASQTRVLEEKYLNTTPPPYHTAVANALRPAAPDHFKIFAVSAMGAVHRVGDWESPPKGKLHSLGCEDPFWWLIDQVDKIKLADLRSHLDAKCNWVKPWFLKLWFRYWGDLTRLKSRINRATPEEVELTKLSRKAQNQLICGLLFWLCLVPLSVEGIYDAWQHERAETNISDPQSDWKLGTSWFKDYANSSPLRHFFYKMRLSTEEATERVRQVLQQKDDDAVGSLKKLAQSSPGHLYEAENMAKKQLAMFPNSVHTNARNSVIDKVRSRRDELVFEKQLVEWQQEFDRIDTNRTTLPRQKLEEIESFEKQLIGASSVPLDGTLRDQWAGLLEKLKDMREEIKVNIVTGEGLEKIRQALEADDYIKAADLLSDWKQPQEAEYKALLNRFQSNIATKVASKTESNLQQGAKWSDAVDEAQKFLEPVRSNLLTPTNIEALQTIIRSVKIKGDNYFYEIARRNRDTETLQNYLTHSPLRSMQGEVRQYLHWLQEREKPRELTFRLTRILWADGKEASWGDKTKIKLFVHHLADSRNETEENDPRKGQSFALTGIREVTIKNLRQTDVVNVSCQVWNSNWGDRELLNKSFQSSPEEMALTQKHLDGSGTELTVAVEGVLPRPELPSWHP